jgi:hypothetical protein
MVASTLRIRVYNCLRLDVVFEMNFFALLRLDLKLDLDSFSFPDITCEGKRS